MASVGIAALIRLLLRSVCAVLCGTGGRALLRIGFGECKLSEPIWLEAQFPPSLIAACIVATQLRNN